ncbi:MAG: aspartate 1-decarboxylase [Candidatus Omnitrophica bacterium]|nr:aspartate 1-decarboxylase [Candidatus Omnitrophota bacterium]
MWIEMFKAKIAHATVTEANLKYEGSITIDEKLLKAVNIIEGERVQVLNINNGNRFDTYVIPGKSDSGVICLNGPAARQGLVGDQVMIIAYASMDEAEAKKFKPKVVNLDDRNKIKNKNGR